MEASDAQGTPLLPSLCTMPDAHPTPAGLREEVVEGAYTLVLEFENNGLDLAKWEERQPKFQSFFGPGIVAKISQVRGVVVEEVLYVMGRLAHAMLWAMQLRCIRLQAPRSTQAHLLRAHTLRACVTLPVGCRAWEAAAKRQKTQVSHVRLMPLCPACRFPTRWWRWHSSATAVGLGGVVLRRRMLCLLCCPA